VVFINGSAGCRCLAGGATLEALFQKSGKPDLTSAAGCPEVFKVGGNSRQAFDSFKYAQDEGTFRKQLGGVLTAVWRPSEPSTWGAKTRSHADRHRRGSHAATTYRPC
jgi:hypothetical protein